MEISPLGILAFFGSMFLIGAVIGFIQKMRGVKSTSHEKIEKIKYMEPDGRQVNAPPGTQKGRVFPMVGDKN